MAEVTARKRGSKWEYRFELASAGKRRQFSKGGFATKKEALLEGHEKYTLYNKTGILVKEEKIGFSDICESWLKNVQRNVKESSMIQYNLIVRKILLPQFDKYALQAISKRDLADWFNGLHYSRAYLRKIKVVLVSIFNYAVRLDFIGANPAKEIRIPKDAPSPKPRHVLSFQDFERILEATPEPYRLALQIQWYTGLRIGEVLALVWSDIDFDAMTVSVSRLITQGKVTTPKTPSSTRTIFFGEALKKILKEEYERQTANRLKYEEFYTVYWIENGLLKSAYLRDAAYDQIRFVNVRENGRRISYDTLKECFKTITEKTGLEFTSHDIRHSHATLLLEANSPIKAVQERLGHSDVKTLLEIYAHVTENQSKITAEIFENLAHEI